MKKLDIWAHTASTRNKKARK